MLNIKYKLNHIPTSVFESRFFNDTKKNLLIYYEKMFKFSLIFQVRNRKGKKSNIHQLIHLKINNLIKD